MLFVPVSQDGLTSLLRHEIACYECVYQHFGPEIAKTINFAVVKDEEGIAIVRDTAFASFNLNVSTPPTQVPKVVSSGVIVANFEPKSSKLRSMELRAYDSCSIMQGESVGTEPTSVSPVGSPRGRVFLPSSFPSVVSLSSFSDLTDEKRLAAIYKTRNQIAKSIDESNGPGMSYESTQHGSGEARFDKREL